MYQSTIRGEQGEYRLDLSTRRVGGQAEVFRAIDPKGRRVAIKLAKSRSQLLARERDALLRFSDRKDASWVVTIRDHGRSDDDRIFMVLDWYEQSLEEWSKRGDQPLARRLRALELAATAVYRLHHSASVIDPNQIVLHRDLKPANFLVRDEGELSVVLADLGGVKTGRLMSVGKNTGICTPSFAPMEQQLPLRQAPNPSVDVHGLAVTIYDCLTGSVPRAMMMRESYHLERSHRLMELHRRREHRSVDEEVEYQRLRTCDLSDFIDLERYRPLMDTDVEGLRRALSAALRRSTADPDTLADDICGLLVPVLEHALEGHPRRRLSDVRQLLAACTQARELVERAVAEDSQEEHTWNPLEPSSISQSLESVRLDSVPSVDPGRTRLPERSRLAPSSQLSQPVASLSPALEQRQETSSSSRRRMGLLIGVGLFSVFGVLLLFGSIGALLSWAASREPHGDERPAATSEAASVLAEPARTEREPTSPREPISQKKKPTTKSPPSPARPAVAAPTAETEPAETEPAETVPIVSTPPSPGSTASPPGALTMKLQRCRTDPAVWFATLDGGETFPFRVPVKRSLSPGSHTLTVEPGGRSVQILVSGASETSWRVAVTNGGRALCEREVSAEGAFRLKIDCEDISCR